MNPPPTPLIYISLFVYMTVVYQGRERFNPSKVLHGLQSLFTGFLLYVIWNGESRIEILVGKIVSIYYLARAFFLLWEDDSSHSHEIPATAVLPILVVGLIKLLSTNVSTIEAISRSGTFLMILAETVNLYVT